MLATFTLQFLCLILITVNEGTQVIDPCETSNHELKKNEEWRSTGISTSGTYHCDRRLVEGWYRVISDAGTDMPTTCPPLDRCGTKYPIWLNDTIPDDDGKVHNKKACVRWRNDCCFTTVNIQVKNCSTYCVSYLSPLNFCPAAYCFGSKAKCQDGKSSNTGFDPCGDHPANTQTPILEWEMKSKNVVFTCRLPDPAIVEDSVIIDVEWYSEKPGENREKITTYKGTQRFATKDEKVFLYENNYYTLCDAMRHSQTPSPCPPAKLKWNPIGGKIYCSIRLRYGKDGPPSAYTYSEGFFAGIKILTPNIKAREGDPLHIKVRPTIPVLISTIHFGLVYPLYQINGCHNIDKDIGYKKTTCTLDVKSFVYTEKTWQKDWEEYSQKEFNITLFVKLDDDYRDRIMSVSLRNTEVAVDHPIWSHMNITDIQIILTDRDIQIKGRLCKSRNDPHMTTFDGQMYENQNPGEFILYKHKRIPVQVNTYFSTCKFSPMATCNCAVACKTGGDVFIIDNCYRKTGVSNNIKDDLRVHVIGCDKKGMIVRRSGTEYTVTLPTGTQVIITLDAWMGYMNVDVKPSVLDIGQTEGLCGTLNNNKSDDFIQRNKTTSDPITTYPNAFSMSWQVDSEESLYNGVQHAELYSWHVYCSCDKNGSTVNCTYNNAMDRCFTKGTMLSKHAHQKCHGTYRNRRAAEDHKKTHFIFEYDRNFTAAAPKWINGWTQEKAIKYCNEYVRGSQIGKTCGENVPNVDLDGPIDNCVRDIKLSGGTQWQRTAVNSVKVQCEVELKKNTSLWKKDPTTGEMTPPSEITNNLCLENCSGHGQCINEICKCDKGYGNEDCGTDLKTAPSDVFISPDDAACETNVDQCDAVSVHGNNFAESDELVCKIKHCKVQKILFHVISSEDNREIFNIFTPFSSIGIKNKFC